MRDVIPAGRELHCSCCGSYFKTWEGYIDQDQDKGYGRCQSCLDWIAKREEAENKRLIAEGKKLLAEALNPENREKFLAMTADEQEYLVREAVNDGVLGYTIIGR